MRAIGTGCAMDRPCHIPHGLSGDTYGQSSPKGPPIMEYLPLFLLFMAALIAGWFYLQRAKARDAAGTTATSAPVEPDTTASTDPK